LGRVKSSINPNFIGLKMPFILQ